MTQHEWELLLALAIGIIIGVGAFALGSFIRTVLEIGGVQ